MLTLTLEIIALITSVGAICTMLISSIRKINEIENKGRDILRILDEVLNELHPLFSAQRKNKRDIAIIKHQVDRVESFLEKDGYDIIPFDEDCFL